MFIHIYTYIETEKLSKNSTNGNDKTKYVGNKLRS